MKITKAMQGSETGARFDAWMFDTSGTSVNFDGEWQDNVVRHSFFNIDFLYGFRTALYLPLWTGKSRRVEGVEHYPSTPLPEGQEKD